MQNLRARTPAVGRVGAVKADAVAAVAASRAPLNMADDDRDACRLRDKSK